MVRLLLFAILGFVLCRILWSAAKAMFVGMGYQAPGAQGHSVGLVRDPMCGTFVLPSTALTAGSGSETRYFCSEKCRRDYGHSRNTAHRGNTEETR